MKSYIDCFNNIIYVRRDRIIQAVDLDNVFCQKINQQSALHTIRFFATHDKIERQFLKTFVNADRIFIAQKNVEQEDAEAELENQGAGGNNKGGGGREENKNKQNEQQSNNEEDKKKNKNKNTQRLIEYEYFFKQLARMCKTDNDEVEIKQEFNFKYPKKFLNVLAFDNL